MTRLSIFRGDEFLEEVALSRAVVGLGRHPENDIVLDDRTLSRFHARVEKRGAAFYVVDLGGQNGVLVNGNRVQGEAGLRPGDKIGLGRYLAVFDGALLGAVNSQSGTPFRPAPSPAAGPTARAPQRAPVAPPTEPAPAGPDLDLDVDVDEAALSTDRHPSGGPAEPTLVLLFNGMEVSRHRMTPHGLVIGRSKQCDIVISLLGLSRRHTRVIVRGGVTIVEDLESQNGTWVNNERIQEPRRLKHGDLLNFYDYAVLFLEDGSVEVSFPGGAFLPPSSQATDELAAKDTGRGTAPVLSSGAARALDPVDAAVRGDVDLLQDPTNDIPDIPAGDPGLLELPDLGEGSFLDDNFEVGARERGSRTGGGVPLSGVGPVAPRREDSTGLLDEFDDPSAKPVARADEDIEADVAFQEAGRSAENSGTEVAHGGLEDETSHALDYDGGALSRPGWPDDAELTSAMLASAEPATATLEISLAGKAYAQIPLTEAFTRLGTDQSCEISLPKSSGLQPWHLTIAHRGRMVVVYRAARTAQLVTAHGRADMATVSDGQVLDLGKVRVTVRIR